MSPPPKISSMFALLKNFFKPPPPPPPIPRSISAPGKTKCFCAKRARQYPPYSWRAFPKGSPSLVATRQPRWQWTLTALWSSTLLRHVCSRIHQERSACRWRCVPHNISRPESTGKRVWQGSCGPSRVIGDFDDTGNDLLLQLDTEEVAIGGWLFTCVNAQGEKVERIRVHGIGTTDVYGRRRAHADHSTNS